MGTMTHGRVTLSADKASYFEYDRGTQALRLVIDDLEVWNATASGMALGADSHGTATAAAAAATLNKRAGKITSEALTTAQNAFYTLTLTNSEIAAGDIVFASVDDGTNTQGTPMIGRVAPGAGSCVIEVINKHATAEALNGTVVISFVVWKAA